MIRVVDVVGTSVVVIVALVMLTNWVSRGRDRPATGPPTVPDTWREEIETGIAIGDEDADIDIIEFVDFQCPGCRRWRARVDSLVSEFPDRVRVVHHHLPLSQHPHSLQAAIAAECAHRQGAFKAYSDALFADQPNIGVRSWIDFAAAAGVSDTEVFADCIRLPPDSFPRIGYGRELALRNNSPGTPTVWVDGKFMRPSLERMRRMVLGSQGER